MNWILKPFAPAMCLVIPFELPISDKFNGQRFFIMDVISQNFMTNMETKKMIIILSFTYHCSWQDDMTFYGSQP